MSAPEATTADDQLPAPSRRCWRCLQTFPCEAADLHAGPAEWWLCEPCHRALIGPTPTG